MPDTVPTDRPAPPPRYRRLILVFGSVAASASLLAWLQTGAWTYLVGAGGFAWMTYAARRMPFKALAWPPPEGGPNGSRAETVVQWLGWGLIVSALVAHYWLV
jgi:hypothetical protein